MEYEQLISKREVEIAGVKFALSKIPAVQAQEIYGDIVAAANDVGDIGMTYLPTETVKKLLSYAAFCDEGVWYTLGEEHRINKACKDAYTLIRLETMMIKENFGFLFDGGLRGVLEELRGA